MINEENDSVHSAESDREISRAGDHVVVEKDNARRFFRRQIMVPFW